MEKGVGVNCVLVVMLIVFLLSFVSASYNFSNYSIEDTYSVGSSISGSLKISFENESINSPFTDSLGNEVLLKSLLLGDESYSYTCGYLNCKSKFTGFLAGSTRTFFLPKGESVFYGLRFNQNLVKINFAGFDLESDATESAENQVSIDFFNDGVIDVKNTKKGNNFGSENFGCFNSSEIQTEITLTTSPYCQEILLHEAPGLKVGAWIKEALPGTKNVIMSLYDGDGDLLNSCILSKSSITSGGSRVFCEIDTAISENGTYFSCINSGVAGNGEYKTRGFSQENNCGFQGVPPKNSVYSYEIGASEKYYGNVGILTIGNNLPNGNNLSKMIENYIISEYGSLDCSGQNCLVPIKIISSKNQSVTLRNLNVNYDFQGGYGAVMNNFYELEEDPSKVNSATGSLSLGDYFKLPEEEGDLDYTLYFKGSELFEKEISLEDFKIRLYPLKSAALFPTDFVAVVPYELEPALYTWDFGDGQSRITSVSEVSHTYQGEGNYTFTLRVLTKVGEVTTSFNVEVGSPREVLSYEIEKRKGNLDDFEDSLSLLDLFEKNEVQNIINISSLRSSLETIEEEESLAVTDEDYSHIISKLLNLSFPLSLDESFVGGSFFIPSENSIDLNLLSSITGKNYNDSQSTYDYIQFWNQKNLNSDITENQIIINWEDRLPTVIRFFELSVEQSSSISEDYYFAINDLSDLNFEDESEIESIEGYKYMKLSSGTDRISFSTTERGQISNFMFISPSVIEIQEISPVEEAGNNIWILVLGMAGVLLIGLFVYLILHKWYQVKYERYLFPDKNHLYNAIFYINNSARNGMEDYEIRKSLLDVGWKGEQVRYLMKKYAGKNTGMFNLFGSGKAVENQRMGVPPRPGINSEYQERGKDTKFNK
ncbi:MAG: PKD domain-containing protein [archaeon]|nr:PKD domain-containing protein [archaeon]